MPGLSRIITILASDQSDISPLLSLAIARTGYVPAAFQEYCLAAGAPLGTRSVHDEVLPSPQSKR